MKKSQHIVKKDTKNTNLGDKKSQTSVKMSQKCKFTLQKVTAQCKKIQKCKKRHKHVNLV